MKRFIQNRPHVALLLPAVALLLFFLLIPAGWIARVSFYRNVVGGYMTPAWVIENYQKFLGDTWYLKSVLWFSFKIALFTTLCSVVIAYPLSIFVARSTGRVKQVLYTITLSPLLIGMVCLIFGWIVIFRGHGILNQLTMSLGITSEPIRYMYSMKGVIICLIYIAVPYVVLNLLDSLSRINPSLEEAAMNVGANRWQTFVRITFPLSVPGMYAGSIVVFTLNFCAFAVPMMVGSERTNMIGLLIYDQAMKMNNLPFAAAVSVILVASSVLALWVYSKLINRYFFRRLGV